jgi:hypothetical protein
MSSRRERSPERNAAMLTVRSRSMEVSERAGPRPNRQRFPKEGYCGEAQVVTAARSPWQNAYASG